MYALFSVPQCELARTEQAETIPRSYLLLLSGKFLLLLGRKCDSCAGTISTSPIQLKQSARLKNPPAKTFTFLEYSTHVTDPDFPLGRTLR
jgi:hypothetical protein